MLGCYLVGRWRWSQVTRDVKETQRRRDALYTGAETRWSLCCRIAHLEADMPGDAERVMELDEGTDGATGRCRCGGCGAAIDTADRYCRRCGARLRGRRKNHD